MNTVQWIVKNAAALFAAQFVVAILSLALAIVIALSLGDAVFGKMVTTWDALTVLPVAIMYFLARKITAEGAEER